jgi:hypothetical protein
MKIVFSRYSSFNTRYSAFNKGIAMSQELLVGSTNNYHQSITHFATEFKKVEKKLSRSRAEVESRNVITQDPERRMTSVLALETFLGIAETVATHVLIKVHKQEDFTSGFRKIRAEDSSIAESFPQADGIFRL